MTFFTTFTKRGVDLLKEGGLLGFITAKYFLKADDASKLRDWTRNNCKVRTLVDFGNVDMFGGLGTRTAVLILEKFAEPDKTAERASNLIHVGKVKCRRWLKTKKELVSLIESHLNEENLYEDTNVKTFTIKQSDLTSDPWELISEEEKALKLKIESMSARLGTICYCCKGMDTGLNDVEKREGQKLGVFHLTRKEVENLNIEPQILRKLVKNSDIDKYLIDFKDLFLVYATDETDITKYPNAKAHLEHFRVELAARYGFEEGKRKWYAMSSPRHKQLVDNCREKLMCPYIASENKFAYDDCSEDQRYYGMTDTTTVVPKENCTTDLKFVLAILNSSLENFYYKTFAKAKDYRYEYFAKSIKKMCIPDQNKLDVQKKSVAREIADLSSELFHLRLQQNNIRKIFSETLRNNMAETLCAFAFYFKNAINYSFQKTVLLEHDAKVQSCEIELAQEGNSVTIKAYYDDNWHAVLKLDFSDTNIRDFIYCSIDKFLASEETSVAWRKGRIIEDVIFGMELPKFETLHVENRSRILTCMAEVKSKTSSSNIGEMTEKLRELERKIDERVYFLYDISAMERRIIEESIDFGKPYLRY